MNKSLRNALDARAKGRCEACSRVIEDLESDHAFGRAKSEEDLSTVWRLCRSCHHDKTVSHPSAEKWLRRYAVHLAVSSIEDPANADIYFHALDRTMTKLNTLNFKLGVSVDATR